MKKSRKKLWIVPAVILLVLLLLFLGTSWFIGRQIVMGSTNLTTNEQTLAVIEEAWALENFDEAAFRESAFMTMFILETMTPLPSWIRSGIPEIRKAPGWTTSLCAAPTGISIQESSRFWLCGFTIAEPRWRWQNPWGSLRPRYRGSKRGPLTPCAGRSVSGCHSFPDFPIE